MKLYLLVGIFLLCMFSSFAQVPPIQNGPRLSVEYITTPNVTQTVQGTNLADTLSISPSTSDIAYGVGMFMQFNIKEYLVFRPEAIVHISNRQLSTTTISNNIDATLKNRLYTVSIPLQLGYNIEGFNLQGGIVLHRQLRNTLAKENTTAIIYEYDKSYTTYTVGLGLQKGRFLLDVQYEKALGDVQDTVKAGGDVEEVRYRPSHIMLKMGFTLGSN